jgi:2-haloacid dehalogenase
MEGQRHCRSPGAGFAVSVFVMWRRNFLQLAGWSAACACAPRAARPTSHPSAQSSAQAGSPTAQPASQSTSQSAPRPTAPPGGIRAVAFDLFTIFDPRGVDRRVAAVLPAAPAAFAATWKTRLFDYCWIRAAADRYAPFDRLVDDSLTYAARAHAVELSPATRAELADAFTTLAPWPDAAAVLRDLRGRGLRLAPLANFAPAMIEALLRHGGVRELFETLISTDAAHSYKPHPRAYALAESRFDLPRTQIAFAAFGGWDAAGGQWFGFPTFWVNRLAVAPEELTPPDATGPDLVHLAHWLAARG